MPPVRSSRRRSSRRRFLRQSLAAGLGLLAAPALASGVLRAAPRAEGAPLRIGHLVRSDVRAAATEAAQGAAWAADEAVYNAQLFDRTVAFESVAADSVARLPAAVRTLQDALGGLDLLVCGTDQTLSPPLVALAEADDLLLVNAGVPDTAWRDAGCHPHLVHVTASAAMHADALAAWGTAARDDLARWTLLAGEDARDQATAAYLERALTERGATVVETLPPGPPDEVAQAAAAVEADATAVCVTGAAQLPLVAALAAADAPLVTGPLLERPRYAAAGVQVAGAWPLMWHPDLFKYGATQLADRYTARYDVPMHGLAYANWAAVTFLAEAALNAESSRPEALVRYLVGEGRFDSRKGKPLTFRPWNQQARQILHVAEASPTGRLALSADVPDALRGDADAITARLDALGLSATESACALR